MSGGTIRNNTKFGILIGGSKSESCTANISGGTISGSGYNGVHMEGNGNKLTMTGGTIEKNGEWGLYLNGAGAGFKKKKGAIIYGNSGDNRNDGGAIHDHIAKNEKNSLHLDVDAEKDEVYTAKINSGQTNIVEGSKQGRNW